MSEGIYKGVWREVNSQELEARLWQIVHPGLAVLGTVFQKPPSRCKSDDAAYIWGARVMNDCRLQRADFPSDAHREGEIYGQAIQGKAHTLEDAKEIVELLLLKSRTTAPTERVA